MKRWKIITLIVAGVLLTIATIVFIVLFAEQIFTENVLAYCIAGVIVLVAILGLFLFKKE